VQQSDPPDRQKPALRGSSVFGALFTPRRATAGVVLLASLAGSAHGQQIAPPQAREAAAVQSATDAVFGAFETHPLVGMSDDHGLAEEAALYEAIVRDPRFAERIGNVVVEFGGAARQDVMDRYVNGGVVPYEELRQVWTDTVGWQPTVPYLAYAHFFAQVREVNLHLPAERRIRVWLGEPPIVWSTLHTREEYTKILETRDGHAADLIVSHVLTTGKKALLIYGGYHLTRDGPTDMAIYRAWRQAGLNPTPRRNLLTLVESHRPGAIFVVRVYTGFENARCTTAFEEVFNRWPMPAIGQPAAGGRLARDLRRCGRPAGLDFRFPPDMPKEARDLAEKQIDDYLLLADAVLFLGPAASLTRSPLLPDLYLDEPYRAEISRQMEIKTGQALPDDWGRNTPLAPRFLQ
jgi:hypothetical protein